MEAEASSGDVEIHIVSSQTAVLERLPPVHFALGHPREFAIETRKVVASSAVVASLEETAVKSREY